jgi:hypothetical protein
VAADTGDIVLSSNTMTDIASRPPPSPRFRRDRASRERRAGAWLRDFQAAATQPGFSVPAHLAELATRPQSGRNRAAGDPAPNELSLSPVLSALRLPDFPFV